jgi:hypothetical protein
MFRPRTTFDPLLIVLQILALQSLFYLLYVLVVVILDFFFGIPFSHHQVLDYAVCRLFSRMGIVGIVGQIFAGLAVALLFVFLEGRSRKALDFISTTFVFHLLLCSFVVAFPLSFTWWLFYGLSWGLSTVLAEFVSQKYEMQDINLDVALPSLLDRMKESDK